MPPISAVPKGIWGGGEDEVRKKGLAMEARRQPARSATAGANARGGRSPEKAGGIPARVDGGGTAAAAAGPATLASPIRGGEGAPEQGRRPPPPPWPHQRGVRRARAAAWPQPSQCCPGHPRGYTRPQGGPSDPSAPIAASIPSLFMPARAKRRQRPACESCTCVLYSTHATQRAVCDQAGASPTWLNGWAQVLYSHAPSSCWQAATEAAGPTISSKRLAQAEGEPAGWVAGSTGGGAMASSSNVPIAVLASTQ